MEEEGGDYIALEIKCECPINNTVKYLTLIKESSRWDKVILSGGREGGVII